MTVTIVLPPETEAKLRDRAAATGKDLSTLIREAVEEQLSTANGNSVAASISSDQWSAEFSAWMQDIAKRASMYPPGYVADDSRESIYQGQGE
jgi:predicted transcriptional regulator